MSQGKEEAMSEKREANVNANFSIRFSDTMIQALVTHL